MCLVIGQSVHVKCPGTTLSYSLFPNAWLQANFMFPVWRRKGSNADITYDI